MGGGTGIGLADVYKALFGASFTGFDNEAGGGLRALDSTTVQTQGSNEGAHA